jgi:hypothetical protein
VPGSDGDHNNVKTDEFNRRNCVLLIRIAKKSTKNVANEEISITRQGTGPPREN